MMSMTMERVQQKPKTIEKLHTSVMRGEIWYADISGTEGSVQGGQRPCLIIQNDQGNRFAPTVIVAPLTTAKSKRKLPTHVVILKEDGAEDDSIVLLEQIQTIDQWCLLEKKAKLRNDKMFEVDKAILISVGIGYLLH